MKSRGGGILARSRNSSVELLRIIGIVLILMNHVLEKDLLPVAAFPWSIVSSLLARLGGLGDVIFFGITAYYLSNRGEELSFKGQLRGVWILERQLLSYSIALFLVTLVVRYFGLGFDTYDAQALLGLGIKSLLPLSSYFWWYASAYAVFLIALPFLDALLRYMGRGAHRALAAVLFIFCAVPTVSGPFQMGWTPPLFLYQYIIFSYVARYLHPSRKALVLLALTSALLGMAGPVISGVIGSDVSGSYLNSPQAFPPMVLGFSLVLLAVDSPIRTNRIVNEIASCAFAAYLIQCYPSGKLVVGKVVGIIASGTGSQWLERILLEILFAVSILGAAIVAEKFRKALFYRTVDRHKGGLFDRLWELVESQFPKVGALGEPYRN